MGERVSVIIPVYNAELYLERCIMSVSCQSHKALEIILVDDGSTDGGTAICRAWTQKDSRISYIRQENKGLGAARNTGITASTSQYLTFLDADDWLEACFIEKLICAMQPMESEVGVCDINYINSQTMSKQTVKIRFDKPVESAHENKSIVNKSRLFAWGKIFKKDLIRRCNFRFPSITYEDIYIPILIASANSVAHVPEPLINYFRNRPGSLCNDSGNIGDIAKGLRLLHAELCERGLYGEYALEFKKIAIAQLRFACRKWGECDDLKPILNTLSDDLGNLLPEIRGLNHKKFYVRKELQSALDKVLPFSWQATQQPNTADYVIDLPVPSQLPGQNKETADFNLAELIMEKVYTGE